MKRQRGKAKEGGEVVNATTNSTTKRTKAVTGKEKAVAVERKEAKEGVGAAEEAAEWASLWNGVDEEMSWPTTWCPFWDMEAMGDAYDSLFADVLWDYEIWDLQASNGSSAPNP